jgi:excisionase family DNA binding protein
VTNNTDRPSPWLTAQEAAPYLRISLNTLYSEVVAGRLRAARIGGRRNLRFLREWCDAYLEASSTPVEVTPRARFQSR